MRNWIAAWTVGALIAGGAAASAQDLTQTRTSLTVHVRVTDHAGLSPRELASAQAHATTAYRAAGFDVVWSFPAQEPEANQGAIDVRVLILPRELTDRMCRKEGLSDSVLGIAINGATDARARIAYIFYDRIEQLAITNRTPVERGLGHVLAHEIGHLLLGLNSHSKEGLMQPDWNPNVRQVQTFTASQVQTIRRRFTVMLAD